MGVFRALRIGEIAVLESKDVFRGKAWHSIWLQKTCSGVVLWLSVHSGSFAVHYWVQGAELSFPCHCRSLSVFCSRRVQVFRLAVFVEVQLAGAPTYPGMKGSLFLARKAGTSALHGQLLPPRRPCAETRPRRIHFARTKPKRSGDPEIMRSAPPGGGVRSGGTRLGCAPPRCHVLVETSPPRLLLLLCAPAPRVLSTARGLQRAPPLPSQAPRSPQSRG